MSRPGYRLPAARCPLFFAIVSALGFWGCSNGSGTVTVRVTLPLDLQPTEVELVLTPFDIAAVVDSMTAASDIPPPDFSALEREMAEFQPQGSNTLDSLRSAWNTIRQDIVGLADSLSDVGRESPGYGAAYNRLRSLHTTVTTAERDLERRMSQLVPPETVDLARRASNAADSLRDWESVALAALPAHLDSLAAILGAAIIIPLPEDGVVHRRLATGNWWVAMRVPHPKNPFLEYYWETSFRLNRLIPVVVPMGRRHMTQRWRH